MLGHPPRGGAAWPPGPDQSQSQPV
jgi:hypothetical protein